MSEKESVSAFLGEEEADEKKVVFSCRIHLFEDGTTAIEPEDGFEYSEPKAFQTLSEVLSWMNARRSAQEVAKFLTELAIQEDEQSSKLS